VVTLKFWSLEAPIVRRQSRRVVEPHLQFAG